MPDGSIKGLNGLIGKLDILKTGIDAETKKALYLSGLKVEEKAKKAIMNGPKTGRVYRKGKKGRILHQASAPGEAPANDTGRLVNSIHTEAKGDGSVVTVSAGSGVVDYAAALEFGTSKMAARPFFNPALEQAKPEIEALMKRAVVNVTKKTTK
ncbi:MAG: HK97-gp10 family putative phage morphogenesis protein [Acetobacteraceae bacterium]